MHYCCAGDVCLPGGGGAAVRPQAVGLHHGRGGAAGPHHRRVHRHTQNGAYCPQYPQHTVEGEGTDVYQSVLDGCGAQVRRGSVAVTFSPGCEAGDRTTVTTLFSRFAVTLNCRLYCTAVWAGVPRSRSGCRTHSLPWPGPGPRISTRSLLRCNSADVHLKVYERQGIILFCPGY